MSRPGTSPERIAHSDLAYVGALDACRGRAVRDAPGRPRGARGFENRDAEVKIVGVVGVVGPWTGHDLPDGRMHTVCARRAG
jgi:hypothetical protein